MEHVDGAELSPTDHAAELARKLHLTDLQADVLVSELRNALVPVMLRAQPDSSTADQVERVLRLADAIATRARQDAERLERDEETPDPEYVSLMRRAGIGKEVTVTWDDWHDIFQKLANYTLDAEARWTARIKLLENRIGFAAEALRGRVS